MFSYSDFSSVGLRQADAAFFPRLRWGHELTDGIENPPDGLVVGAELALNPGFELVKTFGE